MTSYISSSISSSGMSVVKCLKEAKQEIDSLKSKTSKLKDAFNKIQTEISNLDFSFSNLHKTEACFTDIAEHFDYNNDQKLNDKLKLLFNQLKICKECTKKVNCTVKQTLDDKLLYDSFQSGLIAVETKLSSLSIVIEQLNQEKVTKALNASDFCTENIVQAKQSNSHVYIESGIDDLHQQLSDVMDKNRRWQSYNVQRERYVSLLLSKYNQNSNELQKLRERYAQLTSQPDKLAIEQRRHFDKLLVVARQELESQRNANHHVNIELTILKDKHKEELCRLEANVEHWRKRYEEEREALAALNANYENEKRRSNSNAIESKEKQSQIQLLQRQVQLFSEDLRAERKEKDNAVNEINFLKLKSEQLQLELDKYKKPPFSQKAANTNSQIKPKNKNLNKYTTTSTTIKSVNFPKAPPPDYIHLNKENITIRKQSPTRPNRYNNLDSKVNQSMSEDQSFKILCEKSSTMLPKSDIDSLLRCPSCGKQYNVDEHLLLLDHIDVCGD